jgi:hypothetical protein
VIDVFVMHRAFAWQSAGLTRVHAGPANGHASKQILWIIDLAIAWISSQPAARQPSAFESSWTGLERWVNARSSWAHSSGRRPHRACMVYQVKAHAPLKIGGQHARQV